ncbi:MAG TPA: proton-conducting transporter membrane subunit [Blastocatellia bacterium]|nr:proton-conducting transporter membrane subunit [Blastocatellia bacterium]
MLFSLLLIPSLVSAALAAAFRPYRTLVGWVNALLSLVALGAAVSFAGHAVRDGEAPGFGPGEMLRADALSALLMVCVAGAASLTLFLGPGLGGETNYKASQLRRYQLFINLFICSMLLAVAANNVAIMWIAIEATTIFSALLTTLTRTKTSVEASWKYILIGSVGIALAFAGTVLGYFDFVTLSGRAENALNWPVLLANAPSLHPEVMKLAFVFLLVGYGTKAGIAPMHTWKPDAYGEAPAPLVALMSSALFAVAMYAILRWKVVADAAIKDHYADRLLLALGLLSLLIAAFSLVLARNYRRMLAYSSVEHTGLVCLGLGLGPLGVFAALLHLVNHTAAKSLMFFLVGNIERKYGSPLIRQVRGLQTVMPWTGGLFAAGLLALMGLPPFGLFISEFALFRAGFAGHHPWLMGTVLLLLLVAFVSFIGHLNRMLYGTAPEGVTAGENGGWRIAPMMLSLAVLVVLGLTLPAPLETLLNQIVRIVSR